MASPLKRVAATMAAIGLLHSPLGAITYEHFSGSTNQADVDANNRFLTNSAFSWAAEGRGGNNSAGGGDYEHDIHIIDPFSVTVNAQGGWTSGQTFGWRIDYTDSDSDTVPDRFVYSFDPDNDPGTSNSISLTQNGVALKDDFGNWNDAIWVRARAGTTASTNSSSVTLDNMQLTQGTTTLTLTDSASATVNSPGSSFRDNLIVHGIPLSFSEGFTLSGTGAMAWDGTFPTSSNLAYQIKFATIPEFEATGVVMAAGAAAFGIFATRRGRARRRRLASPL